MDVYNQTFLHYYPSDKKIIYKSNLLKTRNKITDPEVLLEEINKYLKEGGDKRTFNPHELDDLLNGASVSSVEAEIDDEGFTAYDTFVDENSDIAKNVEKADVLKKTLAACEGLDIIERKIIKLKGVEL